MLGICCIDSQSKKLIYLKYLILETPYTFFSLYPVGIVVLRTLNALSPVFSATDNNNFLLFCLKNMEKLLQYLCGVCFYSFEKENISF